MNLESRMMRLMMENNQTVSKGVMALEGEKSIILVVMFIATFSFGILPIRILLLNLPNASSQAEGNPVNENLNEEERRRKKSRSQRWKTFIGFANCFSGGVFVAACLLDLFPGNVLRNQRISEKYDFVKFYYDISVFHTYHNPKLTI